MVVHAYARPKIDLAVQWQNSEKPYDVNSLSLVLESLERRVEVKEELRYPYFAELKDEHLRLSQLSQRYHYAAASLVHLAVPDYALAQHFSWASMSVAVMGKMKEDMSEKKDRR